MDTSASMKQIRSERLRLKLLTVLGDGDFARLQYVLFCLNRLVEAEAVCDWLIRNKLTGKRLEEWNRERWGGMFNEMFDHIRARVCRVNTGQAVRAGKDML